MTRLYKYIDKETEYRGVVFRGRDDRFIVHVHDVKGSMIVNTYCMDLLTAVITLHEKLAAAVHIRGLAGERLYDTD